MTKKEIKKFLKAYPERAISPAGLEYTFFLRPDMVENARKKAEAEVKFKEEDQAIAEEIQNAEFSDQLMRLMRKPMNRLNTDKLRERVVNNAEIMTPLMKEKLINAGHTVFVENALFFFLHIPENCAQWIYDNYKDFRSEYTKSMMALVLGFRGSEDMIPFLMEETERMSKTYPGDAIEQGPMLAVKELALRFRVLSDKDVL